MQMEEPILCRVDSSELVSPSKNPNLLACQFLKGNHNRESILLAATWDLGQKRKSSVLEAPPEKLKVNLGVIRDDGGCMGLKSSRAQV